MTAPPDTLPLTRVHDLDMVRERVRAGASVVLCERSETYPDSLQFVVLEDQEAFVRAYADFISPLCMLNELFMLGQLLDAVTADGWEVYALPSAHPVLDDCERWNQPLAIDGLELADGLFPYQQFSGRRAFESDGGFFFNWATGTGKTVMACAGIQELMVNTGQVDLCLVFSLRKILVNFARAVEGMTGSAATVVDGDKKKRRRIYDRARTGGPTTLVMLYEKARFDETELLQLVRGKRVLFVFDEALALDTPIVTPDGWTTVGDIQPGSLVPGKEGWTRVIRKTPVRTDSYCYTVTFDDGAEVVCSENHLWTICKRDGTATETINTNQLYDRLTDRNTYLESGGIIQNPRARSLRVPTMSTGVAYPQQDLPVDPYVLGYWLGDGFSQSATFALSGRDWDFFEKEVVSRGFALRETTPSHSGCRRGYVRIPGSKLVRNGNAPQTIHAKLTALGVLGDKHIPDIYLNASIEQRLQLLQGLMDSDGHVNKSGSLATFTQRPGRLMEHTKQLVRSLGIRCYQRTLKQSGFITKEQSEQLSWTPCQELNPFRMPRKANRVLPRKHGAPSKRIVSVVPTESVPVQCLEVEAEDHLFAVGKEWTLTHNCQKLLRGDHKPTLMRTGMNHIIDGTAASTIWPMSASVVRSSPLRYHDVFELLPISNPLGDRDDFIARYSDRITTSWQFGYPQRTIHWNHYQLTDIRHRVAPYTQCLRKTDPGVREFFQDIESEVIPVQLSPAERELYRDIKERAREAELADIDGTEFRPAEYYLALRTLCNTPASLAATNSDIARDMAADYPRMVSADVESSKFTAACDLIESIRDQGDQVVVFTQWTSLTLHLFARALTLRRIPHVTHHGAMSLKAGQHAQDRFKNDSSVTVFLSSDAGAYGLNFQNARYVIHLETPFMWDTYMQRRDRIDRADSYLTGLTSYVFVTDSTIEQRVWHIMNERRDLAAAVQGTAEDLSRSTSDESERALIRSLVLEE